MDYSAKYCKVKTNEATNNYKTVIPIIIIQDLKVHFNLKKLNRKVQLIVENFENPAWIVRICLNILMPFYINYFLKILEDEFVKIESKDVFIKERFTKYIEELHNKNI